MNGLEKNCDTCAYEDLAVSESPCCHCRIGLDGDCTRWVSLKVAQQVQDTSGTERSCAECKHSGRDTYSHPCRGCAGTYEKPAWQPIGDRSDRSCCDCQHSDKDKCGPPCQGCDSTHGHPFWSPKKEISAVSCTAEVDSKVAHGSKKSAPFLRALAEVHRARAYLRDHPEVDGNGCAGWHMWDALMVRRCGEVSRDGLLTLAVVAHNAIEFLIGDLGLDPSDNDSWPCAYVEIWRVSMFGEKKHGANNWMSAKPDGMHHYENALWRHWIESRMGEERAEDSGCYHAAHMAWNALMLLEMELRGVTNPDWGAGED